MSWVQYRPKAKTLVLDQVYPEGIFIPDYFFGKNVVHLPTVKCYTYTTTTGAMKNAFGGLLNTNRHRTHTWIHETLVDLLAIKREIHSGVFAVMDGTTAGDGPGPRTMRPKIKNIMLASGDQVAIDAVAAKLMGFDPLAIPDIRMAHERGLGVGDPRDIRIAGADLRGTNWRFSVGRNFAAHIGHLCWFGPLEKMQKLFFHSPLVHLFIFGSKAYHDWFRWPVKDRRIFEKWRNETTWGAMFDRYHSAQAQPAATTISF